VHALQTAGEWATEDFFHSTHLSNPEIVNSI
jgi:hypothetical protein